MSVNKKKLKKDIQKEVWDIKSILLLFVSALIVTLLMTSHGFSESWAWEIAKSIITIDGVLLGFIIVGVTLYYSERGYVASRIAEVYEEESEALMKGKIERDFTSNVISKLKDIVAIEVVIQMCVQVLAISIACALSLFGVNDATANNSILKVVFAAALGMSIQMLIVGIYLTYNFVKHFVALASRMEYSKALEKWVEATAKKLDKHNS